jgi:hypothetical protein
MDKVAIFADWANVYQNIKRAAKELSVKGFDHNNICHLTYFFHSFISSDEKIFRIYFYNATAMSGQEVETYIGKAPRFDASTRANFNIYWRTEAVAGDPKSTPAYKQDLSHRQSEKVTSGNNAQQPLCLALGTTALSEYRRHRTTDLCSEAGGYADGYRHRTRFFL